MTSSSLMLSLRQGAFWTYLQGGFAAAVQFATGIAMARLLAPADFGLFAAVTAYTVLLLRQAQFGLPESLIQAERLDIRRLGSVFWAMEAFAVVAFLLSAALAGVVSAFYDDPRFVPLMLAVSANFLVMPFSAVAGAWLRRQMRFRAVAKISMVLTITGAAAGIAAALGGLGVWSFVAAAWTNALLGAWLHVRVSGWHPPRPRMTVAEVAPLLRYGWKLHLNSMLWLASSRVTPMILGGLMGVHALGLFRRAAESARMPVDQLVSRLYQLFFAAFSRASERSPREAGRLNEKVLFAMCAVVFPLLLALWFLAEPFVVGLYGEKWAGAVAPMRLLVIGAFASAVSMQLGALADARGLAGKEAYLQLFGLGLAAAAVLMGSRWGLEGVAAALAVRAWIMLAGVVAIVHRYSGCLRASRVLVACLPAIISVVSGAMLGWAAVSLTRHLHPWVGGLAGAGAAIIGDIVAFCILVLLWRNHAGLGAVRAMIRTKLFPLARCREFARKPWLAGRA